MRARDLSSFAHTRVPSGYTLFTPAYTCCLHPQCIYVYARCDDDGARLNGGGAAAAAAAAVVLNIHARDFVCLREEGFFFEYGISCWRRIFDEGRSAGKRVVIGCFD